MSETVISKNVDLRSGDDGDGKRGEELEQLHFEKVINAFRTYKWHSYQRIAKTRRYLDTLSESHQKKLIKYREGLNILQDCIDKNSDLMNCIVKDVCNMFDNMDYSSLDVKGDGGKGKFAKAVTPTEMDMDKTHSILKQIVREWAVEGDHERKSCFEPILSELESLFSAADPRRKRSFVNVLVPGAGLGRLAHEIARRGFSCQGNEYSMFMLFVSNYILNKCVEVGAHTVHPWIHNHSNNSSISSQSRVASFPDINPTLIPEDVDFSMAAGNFLEVYNDENSWDVVVTCFFMDTAHNIVAYVERILKILKKGGTWINLGPLLYHFAEMPSEDSIEPSYEVLREIIMSYGFIMTKEETGLKTYYTQNVENMLKYEYNSIFFVCQKPN